MGIPKGKRKESFTSLISLFTDFLLFWLLKNHVLLFYYLFSCNIKIFKFYYSSTGSHLFSKEWVAR